MGNIYLDYNATEPISREHFEAIGCVLFGCDANPSSPHSHGMSAKIWLEKSRAAVAQAIGKQKKEIYFTAGATEANNLMIHGVVKAARKSRLEKSGPVHVVTSVLEHASVYDPIRSLAESGACEVTYLPVRDSSGLIDASDLKKALRPETCLVALMAANNEIGTIYPIAEFAAVCQQSSSESGRQFPVHFHCDGVQAIGKIDALPKMLAWVDSFSLSGHKIGALKGIGALYLRSGCVVEPLLLGGGQEAGLRPGTHNMPGIVSLALRFMHLDELSQEYAKLRKLKERLIRELSVFPGIQWHGDLENGLPNTLNFHRDGCHGGELMLAFEESGISVSAGSACSANKGPKSRVLAGLGLADEVASNSIRLSLGPGTGEADVDAVVACVRNMRCGGGERRSS